MTDLVKQRVVSVAPDLQAPGGPAAALPVVVAIRRRGIFQHIVLPQNTGAAPKPTTDGMPYEGCCTRVEDPVDGYVADAHPRLYGVVVGADLDVAPSGIVRCELTRAGQVVVDDDCRRARRRSMPATPKNAVQHRIWMGAGGRRAIPCSHCPALIEALLAFNDMTEISAEQAHMGAPRSMLCRLCPTQQQLSGHTAPAMRCPRGCDRQSLPQPFPSRESADAARDWNLACLSNTPEPRTGCSRDFESNTRTGTGMAVAFPPVLGLPLRSRSTQVTPA